MLHNSAHQPTLTPEIKKSLEQYLHNTSPYFIEPDYKEDTLALLMTALDTYETWMATTVVHAKRSLLQYQAEMVKAERVVEV